ncbi:maleylacetate reductase [Streptomyces hokutonensis]|uniref:maleylacetate reductase n=1 Tax=Streptomyces hokutonensis TaxID=1306990 RepID=UPI000378048C|nr:maleylacetate reductase [Streptomyces hokutonensis]
MLCSPGQRELAATVAGLIGPRAVDIHPHARMHVPAESAAESQRRAKLVNADGCVAVGGGSAIGLGKIVALRYGLPVIAVPTTYAGSEMTPVWGVTENGVKRTGRDPCVLPVSVLYDPALTVTLPPAVSVTSGMNAVAHAVEALYAPDASPIVDLMAEEGVRALAVALPDLVADGTDLDARAQAQYGAWLCGACLGATTMSLHHKLCHALGGTLDLPHAPTHSVVLPHALAHNQGTAPKAVAALGRALGTPADPATHLWDLAGRLGAPRSLRELGMAESAIDRIVQVTLANPYANPREVTADGLGRLLRAAWSGQPPTA